MGLYNVSLSDSDDGLVIVADNVGNVINSSTITNLAYEISWYPWHWQKAHLDEILGSNTPLSGNDILIGGNGSDSVDSGAGNDQIFTGVGNDIAAGGDGYDLLFTGSGDDIGIFASPNTQGFDSYFGGTGNDTLVLALDYQDYKLAEQEIIAYVSQLNSGGENNPFTFNNLGLTATGWENLKVQVAPVIQTGQSVELTEPVGNNGQSGEITATGSLYFSDDAFSQQTVNTTLVLADWSAGELSDELEDLFAESFGGALITGQSDVKAIEWSFSVADTELDFLAAGEKLELSYQVLVSDGQLSDSELVSVIVTGTNDGPIAQHMSTVTSEDAPTATFTLDFSDPDANETHTVSFTTENGVPVNVTDNGDGSFTFLPVGNYEALAAGETATELLIYTVTDATGETSSASISIVIEGQNDAPELKDANISGSESAGSIEIDLTLLGTDVDSDNNGETLSYSISSSPQKGIANIVGQKLVFETGGDFTVLNAGETEVIVIEVTATDNIGASVSNTVTISVEGTNDPNAILTVQDLSAAKLGFEFEGFDLDTGQVITSDIPGLPLNSETYDFTFAYNGNFPVSGTNAVVFQNQTSQTPVEIAFIDETSLLDLTQNHVDLAVFSTNLIDQQFESDDTILLKTQSGDIYAIGNSSENDLPGQDFSVDFDYALISAPVSNDPLLSQVNVTSTSLEIEFQAFDLDSGTAEMALDPLFLGETADFKFAYNGNFPTEEANSALFQNQFSTIPVEIAFLDEVSLFSLSQNHADQAVFTTDLIDQQFESDDTILLKTQSGDVYAIGNSQENDLPGQDFTVNFDYANLTGLF
ncbi:MAG: VCBS domain-containing protein [Roseibium sp.]